VFWSLQNPGDLIARIRETGFLGNASLTSVVVANNSRVFPFRRPAVISLVAAWNALFLYDWTRPGHKAGVFGIGIQMALAMMFIAAVGTFFNTPIRQLVVKDDKSLEMVRPMIGLIAIVTIVIFIASFVIKP